MGSIYKITCTPTGLSYIGQTCDKKYKKDKPYNYGPSGRWCDHVSSARKSTTPLAQAIREHGRDNFIIETIEHTDNLDVLDELEAKWIAHYNTIVPNGMNVAKHGRNKHHNTTTLAEHYKQRTIRGVIRPIRSNGKYAIVYLMLELNDGTTQRLCFGQNKEHSFETAMRNAKEFITSIGCPWTEESSETKHSTVSNRLKDKVITNVRVTTASNLIAVYITTADMASYKDQIRVCFGGKTISHEEAYLNALTFIDELQLSDDVKVQDQIHQSSQQATAP